MISHLMQSLFIGLVFGLIVYVILLLVSWAFPGVYAYAAHAAMVFGIAAGLIYFMSENFWRS